MSKKWQRRRRRLFEIIEVGSYYDKVSKAYDYFSIASIVINLLVSVLYTFDNIKADYEQLMLVVEQVTVAIFAVDYILRVITAKFLYPDEKEGIAIKKYVFSLKENTGV